MPELSRRNVIRGAAITAGAAAASAAPAAKAVAHVRAAIEDGQLQPGERIRPIRDLADEWDVGYSTLTHAMAILQEEGLLVARAGKGTFVAERQPGGA